MEEEIIFVLNQTFYLDGDSSYLRRSSVVLQGSARAWSLSEHRHQPSELWRAVHLAARQQPRQLHEDGEGGLGTAYWGDWPDLFCSDWDEWTDGENKIWSKRTEIRFWIGYHWAKKRWTDEGNKANIVLKKNTLKHYPVLWLYSFPWPWHLIALISFT